ncbi:MAG: RNA polymerase factor sigma-54 [Proteobacteria bacterium]|nr:RNA polymerase factor sigma-54 [Pseudomonadota bacterium]
MKPSLQLRIGHQLTMTPQLQQAIRLLQLSAVDLQNEIQEALETNSMLEVEEPQAADTTLETIEVSSSENEAQTADDHEAFSWELQTLAKNQFRYREPTGNELETLNGNQVSLQDHLLWQMQLTPFSESDKIIAATIIDAINDNGFLTCPLEEIVATVKTSCSVETAEVEAVLHRIQQFDPIGVGARNLGECLKVQLDHLPLLRWQNKAKELVSHHLELLGKRDFPALRRRLGLSLTELREVIKCIQSLNPRPGTKIGERAAQYLIPDVYTYKKQGKWEVELNPDCTPHLQINRHYAQLIKRSNSSTDNQFLRHQLQEARWFLKSIENRNDTLLKVAKCIVAEQQKFLEYGDEGMKPLILHDIARRLEMHESTISRVTTQKYLRTPRGTFELKFFFSSHVSTQEGGECSATAIRAFIKKLIAAENVSKPLSDNKLTKLLEELGIKVARRTVAKYREGLKIPPSNERKKLI